MTHAAPILLVLAQAVGPVDSSSPAFERPIEIVRPGRVAVRLDREIYEGARSDLGDVRVLDDAGGLVPFLLDRGEASAPRTDVVAAVRNQGWRADGAATAVLDFADRVHKTRLRLALSGENFRRRVTVEGSDDGGQWATVVDEAWVFAVPGSEAARYETMALPENDFPLLRVTVHPGEGERGRVVVTGAVIPAVAEPPRRDAVLRPTWTRAEDAHGRETWLTLDLGARHQPFHAIDLDVADERFFREARVDARRETSSGSGPLSWVELGRGAIYRLEHGGRRRECLRLDVSGRERVLRVRLRNGDDRPLELRGVGVRAPLERVAFEAAAGRSYRLAYGAPRELSPSFDLALTAGDPGAWAAAAVDVPLAAARRRGPAASAAPWTERHPALLWGGLLAVVAALGLLTWRALRQVER